MRERAFPHFAICDDRRFDSIDTIVLFREEERGAGGPRRVGKLGKARARIAHSTLASDYSALLSAAPPIYRERGTRVRMCVEKVRQKATFLTLKSASI